MMIDISWTRSTCVRYVFFLCVEFNPHNPTFKEGASIQPQSLVQKKKKENREKERKEESQKYYILCSRLYIEWKMKQS